LRSIAPTGSVSTLPGTYGMLYDELAVDASGNMFALSDITVYRLSSDGSRTPVISYPQQPGSEQPISIAAGPVGSVFVLLRYRNLFRIVEVSATGNAQTVYSFSTAGSVSRIAVDPQGNLAIGAAGPLRDSNFIRFVPRSSQPSEGLVAGVTSTSVSTVINNLVYDANSTLYAVGFEYGGSDSATPSYSATGMRLYRIAQDRTTFTTLLDRFPGGATSYSQSTPITSHIGLAADGAGNVFITNPFNHGIYKLNATGGTTLVAGKPDESGNSD
jgi:hypothetical protein